MCHQLRCVFVHHLLKQFGNDSILVVILFLLIGLEKFEKVLQIIIDYDDSSTR